MDPRFFRKYSDLITEKKGECAPGEHKFKRVPAKMELKCKLCGKIKKMDPTKKGVKESADIGEAGHPPVKGHNAMLVKQIANKLLGDPYSSARIGNGTVYRMSYPILAYRIGDLGQGWIDKIAPRDRDKMIKIKKGLMTAFKKAHVDTSKVTVGFHLGSYVYVNIRVQLDSKDHYTPPARV